MTRPPGVVMGTGGVGPTAHDGEVDLPVTFGEQQSADVGGHLGFGPTNEGDPAGLQHGGHPIGRGTGARSAATSAGSFTARTGDVTDDAICHVRPGSCSWSARSGGRPGPVGDGYTASARPRRPRLQD